MEASRPALWIRRRWLSAPTFWSTRRRRFEPILAKGKISAIAPPHRGFRLHTIALVADRWADDVRLSDVEPRFVCTACGKRGADVRPDFNWKAKPISMMGYR